jgi:hypothetical protein
MDAVTGYGINMQSRLFRAELWTLSRLVNAVIWPREMREENQASLWINVW